jgi:hypothetical protein
VTKSSLLEVEGAVWANHPAKFHENVLAVIWDWLRGAGGASVLDPFAGTGRIHWMNGAAGLETWGVEIEPEGAVMGLGRTVIGDATALPFRDGAFNFGVTSPVWGNRMSDHHEARDDSRRHTYRHTLGRPLHPNNAGRYNWGRKYLGIQELAYAELHRVLLDGLLLNVSDFIKNWERFPAVDWHVDTLEFIGFRELWREEIVTPRNRDGENSEARVESEVLIAFERLPVAA